MFGSFNFNITGVKIKGVESIFFVLFWENSTFQYVISGIFNYTVLDVFIFRIKQLFRNN